MKHQQTSQLQDQNHTIFVLVNKSKNAGVAFALTVLPGPFDLLYASIRGGIVMFTLAIFSFLVLPVVGLFFIWISCIACAVTAAQNANSKAASGITINHGAGKH